MDKTVIKIVRFDDETLEALAPLIQTAKDLRRSANQIESFLGGLNETMRLELQSLDVWGEDADDDIHVDDKAPMYYTEVPPYPNEERRRF